VPQNDYLRHLGGLRRSVPAHILCSESCMPPLARAWVRASARQWNRMLTAQPGVLRDAFLSDMALARQLEPHLAHRTWSGAWLRTLGWLAQRAACRGLSGDYLGRVQGSLASGTLGALRTKLSGWETLAWDAALQNRAAADAARPGSVGAAYAAFAPTPADGVREPGFPDAMPFYFRHTSRFEHEHVRALMRLRCCSDPFAASPTLHYGGPDDCSRCPAGSPKRPNTRCLIALHTPRCGPTRALPAFLPSRCPLGRRAGLPLCAHTTSKPSRRSCMPASRIDRSNPV